MPARVVKTVNVEYVLDGQPEMSSSAALLTATELDRTSLLSFRPRSLCLNRLENDIAFCIHDGIHRGYAPTAEHL
jgi:hypothetical protein